MDELTKKMDGSTLYKQCPWQVGISIRGCNECTQCNTRINNGEMEV